MSGCCGRGNAIGHAGELLQGALRRDGILEPFLITLPAPCLCSQAIAGPAACWSITPHWRTKALRAARIAASHWRFPHPLALTIDSAIPVSRGFGSSTADCVAAVRAVADLAGQHCAAGDAATIVQQAEHACDSTMFGLAPVIFLPERGEVLEQITGEWPFMHVTVIDLGGPLTDTLTNPRPHYTSEELDEFTGLLAIARRSFAQGDAAGLAKTATRSAEIHQRYCPHPHWPALVRLAAASGAYGTAISHSGTAAALLSAHPIQVANAVAYTLSGNEKEPPHANLAGRRR